MVLEFLIGLIVPLVISALIISIVGAIYYGTGYSRDKKKKSFKQ